MAKSLDVDLRRALERVGGDREILARLVEFVIEDSPALLRDIEQGVKEARFADVELAAHSLKGLVSNVHSEEVVSAAREIEGQARAGDRDKIVGGLANLRELLSALLAELNHARRQFATE